MEPTFFEHPEAFRLWLERHHESAGELLVGFRKVGSGQASMTWPQSVDQALCFGWIDGVRRSLGADAYTIRFTPRRPTSIWSRKNIARFAELKAEGLVAPAGVAAFEASQHRTGRYSFENAPAEFTADQLAVFRADKAAWADFEARAPSYRKTATFWVTSAKRPETRAKRLAALIESSAAGRKVGPLDNGR